MELKDLGFSDSSFNLNHPQTWPLIRHVSSNMETFSLGHMMFTQTNKCSNRMCVCVHVCVLDRVAQFRETLTISDSMLSLNIHFQYLSVKYSLPVCVLESYYSACRPSGMCRFQKNSSSIFMWVYAFINVAANCLGSNPTACICIHTSTSHRQRERVCERESYQRCLEMGRTKKWLERLQMALCFRQMKRRLWKTEGKDQMLMRGEGEGRQEGGQREKRGWDVGQEKRRKE